MKYNYPDKNGHFAEFGGRYIPETLMPALFELEAAYKKVKKDPSFKKEFLYYLKEFVGRPTPLYFAERLSREVGGAKIYLKREDLNHTGAHKVNNTIGQILLAQKMGKKRIIAETGAGQHGVATATVAAVFNLQCDVFMGKTDIKRQALNVFRMRLLGTNVIPVTAGSQTLKDAMNEAIRDWATNIENTYYLIGTVSGPHPYPWLVRDFQKIIGEETKRQIKQKEGRLPEAIVACIGGGSNAMGIFYPFIKEEKVQLYGVEAAGKGISTKEHAASIGKGAVGILHGTKSYLLQDKEGQINEAYSISAGLDYPGVGPEHAHLYQSGRAQYKAINDKEAIQAFKKLSETEGIIPALESAHAIAYGVKLAKTMSKNKVIVINLSGRGDKDMQSVAKIFHYED